MKTSQTLQEMAVEVARQTNSKRDFIADTRQLTFAVDAETDNVKLMIASAPDDIGAMGVRRSAHRQFASTLGIPGDYYRRMQQDAPDLLARNLNHWLDNEPSNRLVRTIDGDCRALLSDSYRPLDNFDLATAALPVFAEHQIDVQSCNVSEDKFYLKAIVPGLTAEIMPNGAQWGKGHHAVDQIQGGIIVSNSEVGSGSLCVQPGLHTVKCTNLATFKRDAMRKTHLGRKHSADEFARRYMSAHTRQLEDAAFWNQLRDFVVASLDGRVFNDLVNELRRAKSNAIDGQIADVVEVVQDQFQLRQSEQASVLQHLIEGNDLTQYGVHSAITRASQDVDDYDRASDLEEIGGKVIELSNDQWSRVNIDGQRLTERKTRESVVAV